jgi:hypothetical protein
VVRKKDVRIEIRRVLEGSCFEGRKVLERVFLRVRDSYCSRVFLI